VKVNLVELARLPRRCGSGGTPFIFALAPCLRFSSIRRPSGIALHRPVSGESARQHAVRSAPRRETIQTFVNGNRATGQRMSESSLSSRHERAPMATVLRFPTTRSVWIVNTHPDLRARRQRALERFSCAATSNWALNRDIRPTQSPFASSTVHNLVGEVPRQAPSRYPKNFVPSVPRLW